MSEREDVREVLAGHFIMWRSLYEEGPQGEWFCECGAKFGFSDSAIDHQVSAVLASPWLAAHVEAVRVLERVRLAGEVEEVIADHPMWIGDDGEPLDYLPEREARIADFCQEIAVPGVRLTEEANREAGGADIARVTASINEMCWRRTQAEAGVWAHWANPARLRLTEEE